MTKQPFFQLQTAIFETLTSDDAVMAIIGVNDDGVPQVYDGAPDNPRYPYILIGEDSFSRMDWYQVAQPLVTCVTQEHGRMSPIKQLAAAVQDALDVELQIDGFTTTEWQAEEADFGREYVDGMEIAELTFRYVLDPDEGQ